LAPALGGAGYRDAMSAQPDRTASVPPLTLDAARGVLDAQPFSRLVGAELAAFEPGRAELRVPLRAELLQQFGFVHGGLFGYAVDNALTFAGGSVLGPSVVTRGFAVEYLRPGQGALLIARAEAVSHSRRQALCRCDVFVQDEQGDETHCAAAQGTIAVIDLAGREPV